MASIIGTGIDEEELRRQQEEAERIAREEAARAEEEAAAQVEQAQQQAAEATEAAQEQAQQQAESAAQETAPLNPAAPETPDPVFAGVRSGGMGRITAQDKLDAQFMRETREAIQDTRFKVSTYDTAEGYDQSKNRAHMTSMLVGHAADLPIEEETGNKVSIDYRSIRNKEQAYMMMMVYSDDKAKVKGGKKLASALGVDYESFLAEAENYVYDKYGRNVFSTPYSPAAKNRAYTATLDGIGLMGVDGSPLDVGTATTADIFRACKMDPSGETADAVYALVKEAAKIPGNPWYGMDVKEDMFKFVDSADLTSTDYEDWVDNINTSFTFSDGLTDDNLAAYISLYDDIHAKFGDNQRVVNYLIRDLNKSFGDHTGHQAPTKEQAERALAETEAARLEAVNGADSDEEAREGRFGAILDWVMAGVDWLKNLGKKETATGEPVEYTTVEEIIKELDAGKSAGGSSPIMSGGTVSMGGQELSVSKPIASTSMPSAGELFPDGGTQEEPGFDNPLGLSQETLEQNKAKEAIGPVYDPNKSYIESAPYDPEMTDAQALMLQGKGYRLAPENYNQISRFVSNPEIYGVMYGQAAEYQSGQGGSSSALENMAINSYRKHGSFLGELAQDIAASDLDEEGKSVANLALMRLTADIYDMWADPQSGLSRPNGANMYDYAFEQGLSIPGDETGRTFLEEYYSIKDSLKVANTAYSDNVVKNEEERVARLAGYTESMLNGTGNQAMADALADAYSMDWVDVEADDKRNELVNDLYSSTSIFASDGSFWQGDSMVALEYKAIKGAGSNQGALNFQQDVIQRTNELIDSYTTAAHNIGTTLDKFLAGAGITSADQLVGISYNSMRMEGKALLADKEMQANLDTAVADRTGNIGALVNGEDTGEYNLLRPGDAVELGSDIGWTGYWEGMAQAAYIMTDIPTHRIAVSRNRDKYIDMYGPIQAPFMYRRDLNELKASGALSEEMAAQLDANMERAYNIFDIGYEIDPKGLKGVFRQSQAELGKKLDTLNAVVGTLAPEQQRLVNMVSGGIHSLTGIAVTAVTGGVGRVFGLPAKAVSFVASTLGTGMTTFSDAFDENKRTSNMSDGVAACAAFFEAAGMTLIENGNTGSTLDLLFGDAGVDALWKSARQGKKAYTKVALGMWAKNSLGEGGEELLQTTAGHIFDIFDTEYEAYDRGEGVSFARALGTMEKGLRETDYVALGKEAVSSYGAGVAYGAAFGIAGAAYSTALGAGRMAFKDARAFKSYESVNISTKIVEGNLEATDENLGKLYSALKKDLQDPEFCRYLDKGSVQATKNRQLVTAMLENTAGETLNSAVGHAMKAQDYQDKADAASVASETAKEQFFEIGERVESGELKPSEMDDALAQWQKAQTAYNEAYAAANKEITAAGRDTDAWLKACMERAGVLTSEGMKVRMGQIANARIGLAKRLDVLYANAEQARADYEASLARDAKAQTEVDYAESAVFSEDTEIDEELAAMADEELGEDIEGLNAQIADAEARVAEVSSQQEELGLGGDTVQALVEQELAPLSKRKERIIAREKGRFNDAFDRMQQALEMDNEDAANEIQTEYDGIASRLQTLGVDTDALIAEQYGVAPEEANAAYEAAQEQEAQRAEDEKYGKLTDDLSRRMEATSAGLEAINPARWYFMKNPIYVNESQAADILAADGLKSISQFNRRYGTKLTTKEADGAMPLDGHVLSDISSEAAGSVRTDGDPVAEMLTVLHNGKELAATQRAEKAEAKELRETKKAADKQRRSKVDALAKPIQTEADAAAANNAAHSAIEVTTSHTAKQQRDILAFQKAVDNDVLRAAQTFRQDPNSDNIRIPISKVGSREAADIKSLAGVDVTGYEHTADRNFFRHVENRHGANGEADQSMSELDDVARVGWVIGNYDSVELVRDGQGDVKRATGYIDKNKEHMPLIRYEKRLDGSVYVVEAVGESKWKKLWLVSAYIQKNGPANQSQNQAVTQTPHATSGLEHNVLNANASPANNSVAQGGAAVNNNPNISAMASGGTVQTPAQKQQKRSKKLEGSALKAIQNLANDMKVGLRIKSGQRFQSADARMGKNVLGYYKNGQRNAIVRSADAGRVSVTGHEIGHALQEQLGIQSNQQMITSWQNTFGNTGAYTPQQYDHEAFAEFFWRYLTSRDAAVAYAGDSYVDGFEQAMRRKKLNRAVAKAQAQVSAYWNSEAEAKIRSRMVNAYDAKTPEDTAFLRRVEIRYADDTAAAEDLQDVIRARTGQKHLSLEDNLRDTIRFNRRAAARANECITTQLVDQNGDYVGESLKDALSDVKGKDFDLFWEYELAKHSLARDTAKGAKNQVFDEDTLSTADRQAFVAKMEKEHPEFKTANDRFQRWRRLFMDTYLVSNGFLGDPKQASLLMDALEAAYPNYVPTYRVKGKRDKAATIGGRKYQMRTATGSTEDIINPFDSFVSMVNSIVQMTADNDSRKKFADLYDRYGAPLPGKTGPGIGLFANEITQDMQKVSVSTESMREKITKMLDALGTAPDVIMQISDIIGDEKVEYHGTGKVNMNNVITVRGEDGGKRYFEVYNPELFELLAATNTPNDPGVLDKLAKATRMMSMLTTGSNPVFGLTNMMRDFQNSVNYGSWASSYADGAVKWLGALWDVVSKGEASQEYDALGGGGWTAFDTKTKKGAEQVRGEVFKGYSTSNIGRIGKMAGRKIWEAATFEKVNEAIEKASRVAEYKYGKHDRTTTEGRIEAFLASQDVTTDFARRGSGRIARDLKSLVPFFNASMQGVYRNARQLTAQESDRAGIRFAKNVVNATLASAIANGILLSALDDDEKEEFTYLSDDLKAKHMFLPNFAPDIFGNAALIRIPLDQNPITYAVNAAVTNFAWYGETDNEFVMELSAVADVIKDNLNPVGSTILDPAIAMLSNKNWYGSDIVPSYLESYDETNQYTEETPTPFVEMSKALSDVGIKVSPMMLQYMAEQYTGYIGQTLIPALPSEKNQSGVVSGVLDSLVATARKRVTSDPLVSNGVISSVYDSFDDMTTVYKAGNSKRNFDIDYLNPSLSDRGRRRAIREADDLIHSGGEIYEAKKDISAGYDKIDQINDRDDLTDDEKYTLTQKVRRDMIETALDVRETMNDYDTRYKNDGIVKRFMTWLFS